MDPPAQAAAAAAALAAEAARAANTNDRNVKLQEFDGDKPPWPEWVEHMQKCKNATNWTEEATAERAKLMLTGKAAVWLKNQEYDDVEGLEVWFPEPDANGVQAPNLRTLMEKRFSTTVSPSEQAQLRLTLQQKEGEDVNTFFDRVKAVQFELDKSLPLNFRVGSKAEYQIVHNRSVYDNFLCGLKPDIRTHVTTTNSNTIATAKDAALAYEQGAKARKAKLAAMAPAPDQACSLQTLQAQINALSTSLRGGQRGGQRGGNRGGQGGGATHNSTEFCKYCGYVGHAKPKCNIRKKDEAKGLFLAQSPYFEPGRVGRGGGRGRGNTGRRGQVAHMGATMDPRGGHTEQQGPPTQQQWPPMQPQASAPPQQPNPSYNPYGGAPTFQDQGAFRYFPHGESGNQ